MRIYFLRHGEADWPNWDRPDDERPLTKKGKKEMRRFARFMDDFKISPSAILSSPLPRAYETAEIVSEELELPLAEEPSLAPGFNVAKLGELLKRQTSEEIMLVGHEPDFSQVIAAVTGGHVKLAKAGLARVDTTGSEELRGQLIWLIPPKIAGA